MSRRSPRMSGESNRKENVEKKYYSVSDIIRKVLKDLKLEYSEANARNIRRIIESFYKYTNIEKKTNFSKKDMDLIYGLTKNLFLNTDAKKIFNKLGNKKELDIEEVDILANIFAEALEDNYSKEEAKVFLESIEKLKGEDFLECSEWLRDKFENKYTYTIEKLYSLRNTDRRDKFMSDFKSELINILNKFKYKADKECYMEYVLDKIKKNNENDREEIIEILKFESIKYDMFKNRNDHEFLINSFIKAIENLKKNKIINDIDIECIEYSNELIDIVSEEMWKNQMECFTEKLHKIENEI